MGIDKKSAAIWEHAPHAPLAGCLGTPLYPVGIKVERPVPWECGDDGGHKGFRRKAGVIIMS